MPSNGLTRLAIVCDLQEEHWPSMDLVAEMLDTHLEAGFGALIRAERIRPALVRRFGQFPGRPWRLAGTLDRVLGRLVDYPRWLRHRAQAFDLFHVVDHSYGHLVHSLPPDRTVVTCHDLDTFRSLLEPAQDPRSAPYRAMTRHILQGFRKAARITCDSMATRDELLAYDLVPPDRVIVVPNGVHPSRSPHATDPAADREAARVLGPRSSGDVDLLHVGSTIPRKRIDLLLRVFAAVCGEIPRARLVRVGGRLTPEQAKLAERLNVTGRIRTLPYLSQPVLSAVYRRASVLLLPSEREGFGLPVVEALASGTPVVATDLPALREAGGHSAEYCPRDVTSWTDAVLRLVQARRTASDGWQARRQAGLRQAARFSWAEYARRMVQVYRALAA